MTEKLVYSATDLLHRLPHRHPFVVLDQVTVTDPGRSGTGVSLISASDPIFAGHFPMTPIYPGVMLVEIAAQTAGIVATAGEEDLGGIPLLTTIRRFSFRKPVVAGDKVDVQCHLKVAAGDLKEFTCRIEVAGELRATGNVSIAISTQ